MYQNSPNKQQKTHSVVNVNFPITHLAQLTMFEHIVKTVWWLDRSSIIELNN